MKSHNGGKMRLGCRARNASVTLGACLAVGIACSVPANDDGDDDTPASQGGGGGGMAGARTGGARPGGAYVPDAGSTADAFVGTSSDGSTVVEMPGGSQLVIASGTGTIFTFRFDDRSRTAATLSPFDVGAPITAIARRPGSDHLLVFAQAAMAPTRIVSLRWQPDGALVKLTETAACKKGARLPTFDRSGRYLVYAADGAFCWADVAQDGSVGDSKSLLSCNAGGAAFDAAGTLLAPCGYEKTVHSVKFTGDGPASPKLLMQLTGTQPLTAAWASDVFTVHGFAANGIMNDQNTISLVSPMNASPLARIAVRPPMLGPMAIPFATALAVHPTLPVAYALDGDSYQYGGAHLAVVARASPSTLEVRQYQNAFMKSYLAAVSPDGRFLFVGSHAVSDVRMFDIDNSTGTLSGERVLTLMDQPIGLLFR